MPLAQSGKCPSHDRLGRARLPTEKGAVQDRGADEIGEAFEAGFGGGGGDQGLFLVGKADVDLGCSIRYAGGVEKVGLRYTAMRRRFHRSMMDACE